MENRSESSRHSAKRWQGWASQELYPAGVGARGRGLLGAWRRPPRSPSLAAQRAALSPTYFIVDVVQALVALAEQLPPLLLGRAGLAVGLAPQELQRLRSRRRRRRRSGARSLAQARQPGRTHLLYAASHLGCCCGVCGQHPKAHKLPHQGWRGSHAL